MRASIAVLAAAGIGAWAPAMARAQAITVDDLVASWDIMTTMVVESAKRMPAEHFAYTPGPPLRNFADQINHTTQSNLSFSRVVNAGAPDFRVPARENPPQTKDAVVDLLEKSFAHFRKGLVGLSNADLEAGVPWGPSNNSTTITRLKAILIVVTHLQREHGKTIMYLRAQGIEPAPSGDFNIGPV